MLHRARALPGLWIGCALALAAFAQTPATAPATRAAGPAPGDVLASFAAPCKYPLGLAADGTHLYVLDWREAQIHQVAPADGRLVRSFPAPALHPHGFTFGDGKLFVADDHTGWVYALNPATGVVEHSFEAPGEKVTGLAYAGDELYLLERKDGQIYKLNPADGTILAYYAAPNESCTALAWDGRHLWAADRVKNELYLVWPADGTVLGILPAPGPYVSGVAFYEPAPDPHVSGIALYSQDLWTVDFQTRQVQRLATGGPVKHRLSETRAARTEYLWGIYNYGPGELRDLAVNVAIPGRLANQELLSELRYSQPPTRLATDKWGQPVAVFEIGTVPAGKRQTLGYSVESKVSAIRWLIYPDKCGRLTDIPEEIRSQYTVDGARYRINTPGLKEIVQQVIGDEQNPYWIARKAFNHVIEKLEYEMVGGWDIPEVVLKRGKGSCSEYTFAFIALCRAAGLPARYQGSVVVRGDDASIDEAFHRWAEVYLPNYGWVPVDANKGDAKQPADRARGFGELSNRFLITTHSGGESDYLDWGYNAFARYKATGYTKVEEENFGFWEPLKPTTMSTTTQTSADPTCP